MSFVFERPRTSIGDTFAGGMASVADIYAAARDAMLYVDNTFATNWALDRAISERNDEVFKATGVRPDHPFRRDFQSVAVEAAGRGETIEQNVSRAIGDWQGKVAEAGARIPDQSVADRLNRSIEGDAIRIARESDANLGRLMASRGGFTKWLGAIAGGVSGSMRDPVQIASLAVGGGPGAGRTVAGRILSAAAKEAFVNGAAEALMQPKVQAWREKAGLDHGLEQALANVGFAAAIGGIFGGAGQAIGEGAAKLSGRALDAAGDVAAIEPRVAEPLRRAMAGDVAAARQVLPEIREALPPAARGALDHAETIEHLELTRPAAALPDRHDLNVSAAHQALDAGTAPAFPVDQAQVRRVVSSIVGEEIADAGLPKALTLVEFLKSRGGVKDFQGELQAIGAGDLARPRGRRDRRASLDAAREAAEEAGYIGRAGETQVTSVSDLLDAVDREQRGQPVYSRQDLPAALDRVGREAEKAGLERTVTEIAAYAGPAVDDAIIREAAELAVGEGMDAFDALERVFMRADREDTRQALRTMHDGDALPGWSDAELEAASAGRGPEPAGDFFPDPAKFDEDLAISPAELEEFAELQLPGERGVVSLAAYMEEIAHVDELASIVKACRA